MGRCVVMAIFWVIWMGRNRIILNIRAGRSLIICGRVFDFLASLRASVSSETRLVLHFFCYYFKLENFCSLLGASGLVVFVSCLFLTYYFPGCSYLV